MSDAFWSVPEDDLLRALSSTRGGLTADAVHGRDTGAGLHHPRPVPWWRLVLRQVGNPIVVLLLVATGLSIALGDTVDGSIILTITALSAGLGYLQERGAVRVVEELLASVTTTVVVRRGGVDAPVPIDDVVAGDLQVLRAGDVVAGDARVIASSALLVDEAVLTGESFPVEKSPGVTVASAAMTGRVNAVWAGTHVVSGSGLAVVASVGRDTVFGGVGERLAAAHIPTAFEVGLRRFGLMLVRIGGTVVGAVLAVNLIAGRDALESVLFALALAVGLTPQLLPAIVTVTLSSGARRLAREEVIVKRLDAIEDIGAMDVLCTDKTGTLTSGDVRLADAVDLAGAPSPSVLQLAATNAAAQRSFPNPIDRAVLAAHPLAEPPATLDEIPYDFARRMLSVLIDTPQGPLLITKGAFANVLDRCRMDGPSRAAAMALFEHRSAGGARVLGVATRLLDPSVRNLAPELERDLELVGLLCLDDPPKEGAREAIEELRTMGVRTVMITGDNRHAAANAAHQVGLDPGDALVGADVARLGDDDLRVATRRAQVFAEIDPLQKERIVEALRADGHTVGFLGDGINDAPSLRNADVGISVDDAVDVAKHAASIVLLRKDLSVIAEGIRQGRRVFTNTVTYVRVTISANFGNICSMAVAALLLPFLPLLPRQILLLNVMSDLPAMMIAGDRVDPERTADPHGWDLRDLRRFMVVFGAVSSLVDLTCFAVLRLWLHATPERFRTTWFVTSVFTELTAMLVLRTRRRFWRSRPGRGLLMASIGVLALTVTLPFTGLRSTLGFTRPDAAVLMTIAVLGSLYVVANEVLKPFVDRRATPAPGPAPLG